MFVMFIFSHFMYLHLYFYSLLKWCMFKHSLLAKGFRTKMFNDLNYFVEDWSLNVIFRLDYCPRTMNEEAIEDRLLYMALN